MCVAKQLRGRPVSAYWMPACAGMTSVHIAALDERVLETYRFHARDPHPEPPAPFAERVATIRLAASVTGAFQAAEPSVIVPSPLVGEGSSAGRRNLGRVRGSFAAIPLPRQPLTRLRFAQPPSPTRGEGAPEFGATFVGGQSDSVPTISRVGLARWWARRSAPLPTL